MTSIVLTHYPPHATTSGAPLRNWQNIRALGSFGAVDVVTVGVDDATARVEGIREYVPFSLADRSGWDRLRTACAPLRPGIYPGVDMYYSGRVGAWLRRRAARHRYDVAIVETIALAAYVDDLKRAADRVVFDAHNLEATLQPELTAAAAGAAPRLAHAIKIRVLNHRMRSAERRAIARADLVWACSRADVRKIGDIHGRRSGVTVVPNGVDVDAYRRPGVPPADADWSGVPITMVYPGLFSYPPNEDAALRLVGEVLPAVRARGHAARVVLVGRNPPPALLRAAASDRAVEVTGAVDSVLPYLERPCVITLPIAIGGGTRLKIAEGFAVGRPIVSTRKGAEGIEAVDGEHLLIRDDADSMARAVIDLWQCRAVRARMCEAALDLARARYSWEAATAQVAASLGLRSDSSTTRQAAWDAIRHERQGASIP